VKGKFSRIAVALAAGAIFNRTKHWPVFYTFLSEKKPFVVRPVFVPVNGAPHADKKVIIRVAGYGQMTNWFLRIPSTTYTYAR
jgi:hypothetical protein